mgnify:CR=1 FL=1
MSEAKIRYQIFKPDNAVVAWVNGSITFNDMLNYIKTLVQDPDFEYGMNSFYDLSKCTNIVGELTGLTGIAATLNDNETVSKPCRTAVVVPDENEKVFKLAQGLVLMTSRSLIEHKLFKYSSIEQAYEFLGFNQSLVARINNA